MKLPFLAPLAGIAGLIALILFEEKAKNLLRGFWNEAFSRLGIELGGTP